MLQSSAMPSRSERWETLPASPLPRRAAFATTHWSLVLQAGNTDSADAESALGKLYESYAYPLYAYLRRKGQPPEAARDLVQEIFLALLRKNQLASVSRDKGRFRSYLLSAANHLLANEWTRLNRQKRGGGQAFLAWDALSTEDRFQLEPSEDRNPSLLFEQRWATTLLERVFTRLRSEWTAAGKSESFESFRVFLSGDHEAPSYATLAHQLHLSEGSIRVAIHRLRQRYRDLLRAEIAQTLANPEEVDEELRHLVQVLRS